MATSTKRKAELAASRERNDAFWKQNTPGNAVAQVFPASGDVRDVELIDPKTGEFLQYNVTYYDAAPDSVPWYTQEELQLGVHFILGKEKVLNSVHGEFPCRETIDLQTGGERLLALTHALQGVFDDRMIDAPFYVREKLPIPLDGGKTLRVYAIHPIELKPKK